MDLTENNKVVTTKITKLNGETEIAREFTLTNMKKVEKSDFQIQISFNDYSPATNFSHATFAATSEVCSIGCFIK